MRRKEIISSPITPAEIIGWAQIGMGNAKLSPAMPINLQDRRDGVIKYQSFDLTVNGGNLRDPGFIARCSTHPSFAVREGIYLHNNGLYVLARNLRAYSLEELEVLLGDINSMELNLPLPETTRGHERVGVDRRKQ